MSFGTLKDIDTRGSTASAIAVGDETWAAGDILFAHPTVDGKLTKVRPQHDLVVAFITVRHASAGQLAVRITSGNHLEWLHDVEVEDPADEQILAYDATAGLWKNIDIPESAAVISSPTAPANTTAIWFNTENGNTYIYYDDFWTSIAGSTGAPIISDTAPTDPVLGTQWFNSSTGKSYLYYSNAWIEIDSNGTATASTGNVIINGAFDIWQRGTSFTGVGTSYAYQADRFRTVRGAFAGGINVSREPAGLDGFEYAMKIQRQAGNTSTTFIGLDYALETEDSMLLVGKTVTLSFYAKAGANFSAPSLGGAILTGTGNDQPVSGFTNLTSRSVVNAALTISWQRFTTTATIPTGVTQIGISFTSFPTGTAGAEDSVFITGVQLESGPTATPFRRNAPSIQAELAACQRYYQRITSSAGFAVLGGSGFSISATIARMQFPLLTTLRANPTSVEFSGIGVWDTASVYNISAVALTNVGTPNAASFQVTANFMTAYRPATFICQAAAGGFLAISAEL
jgi:hypothetical protein